MVAATAVVASAAVVAVVALVAAAVVVPDAVVRALVVPVLRAMAREAVLELSLEHS